MAQNKAAIKARIKSVNATKKITGAMEVVSNVKLQKQSNQMRRNREYASVLKSVMARILSREIDLDNVFLKENGVDKTLYFVFYSDLGLCGGFNTNLTKYLRDFVKKDDYIYSLGTKEYTSLKKEGYNLLNQLTELDPLTYLDIKKLADSAIEKYRRGEIGKIAVIYTSFINNVTFEPHLDVVLPCLSNEEFVDDGKELLIEPDANQVLNSLIPLYVENEIFARFLENKTSEQGARRFAMENATDNANELTEKLTLAYNQARQAAITQEITEIVSGADAL